jgi:intron-binding protein aquarius
LTQSIIWDENVVPSANFVGTECLALPKLNLQYLTFHDHLLRNFTLFRLESTYEIRQDLQDVIRRLQPRKNKAGTTIFKGWARMAVPIARFAVTRVGKPKIGEDKPAMVIAEVTVNLPNNYSIRSEWESIRSHDILFLMTFKFVSWTSSHN